MNLFKKRILFILIISITCLFWGCSESIPPERQAVKIVKDSHVISKDLSVSRYIDEYVRQKGDDVKPFGWSVEKLSEEKYFVSYKYQIFRFNEGAGEKGFFFEVNIDDESVIDKTGEYLEKLKPLSSVYDSEKEIFKEIINEDSVTSVLPGN